MRHSILRGMPLLMTLFSVSITTAQEHWQVIYETEDNLGSFIEFVTPEIGWINGIDLPYTLYKTTDGGYSWIGVIHYNQLVAAYFNMYDERRGIANSAQQYGITTDGEHWDIYFQPEEITVQNTVYLDSLNMLSTANTIWGPDSNRRQLCRSYDGGLNWSSLYVEVSRWGFTTPTLSPEGTLIMGAADSTIWRSTDWGQTWQAIENLPFFVGELMAAGEDRFYGTTPGTSQFPATISRSTDDGLTWEVIWTDTLHVGRYFRLRDIEFTDPLSGWVSGDDNWMMRTTDGGDTWETDTLPTFGYAVNSLSFLDSTLGWGIDPGVGTPTRIYRWGTSGDVPEAGRIGSLPQNLFLESVFPNPFNGTTNISVHLARSSMVTATIYDLLGRPAEVLLNQPVDMGQHQLQWKGSGYATGVYFLHLKDGTHSVTSKLFLVR